MATVKSFNVNSGEVKKTCELCEERGGSRRGNEVTMPENKQLERLIEAMDVNTIYFRLSP